MRLPGELLAGIQSYKLVPKENMEEYGETRATLDHTKLELAYDPQMARGNLLECLVHEVFHVADELTKAGVEKAVGHDHFDAIINRTLSILIQNPWLLEGVLSEANRQRLSSG